MQSSRAPARLGRWFFCLVILCGCVPREGARELELPARSGVALGGAAVAAELRGLDLESREERIFSEIISGNVPTWLRRLARVDLSSGSAERERRVTFWVTPDYLAVGSDQDFVLAPMSPQTAQRIADRLRGSLPTPRMVDAVWKSADVRLAPIRMRPDHEMRTVAYFERHNDLIRGLRMLRGVPEGAFVAGHKKDLVLWPGLAEYSGRVAIYGWHRPEGQPIQPLSTALTDDRVDFSHGVRIVHRDVLVDGIPRDIADVLSDPDLAYLLSSEGVIPDPRYPVIRVGA